MRKLVQDAGNVVIYRATWGGSQNFLGTRWVERVVDNCPAKARERLALRFLSLSPHYFYQSGIPAEHIRNRQSRQVLADTPIAPYLTGESGCSATAAGRDTWPPRWWTRPLPPNAAAAAWRPMWPTRSRWCSTCGRRPLTHMLATLGRQVSSGGVLLLHFAVPDQVWRAEEEWLARPSLGTRAKLHYGLNRFGRSAAQMTDLVTQSGSTDVSVQPLSGQPGLPADDVGEQHWLTARRR